MNYLWEKIKTLYYSVMLRAFVPTSLALIGFAGNSIICRLALETNSIDASSFTAIRLFSGALTLAIVLALKDGVVKKSIKGRWLSALMLFAYAAAFSFAYNFLDAGTGALILFATVQVTMVFVDYIMGNRLSMLQWSGLLCAFSGFIVLMLPSITTPPLMGILLMAIAGSAWGIYTINGKSSQDNLSDTTGNFIKSLPFASLLFIFTVSPLEASPSGILLAVVSGSLTTGVIYVVWYVALDKLSIAQGAVVQLLVPVIAALGGFLFLDEAVTGQLAMSSLMILGGVLIVLLAKHKPLQTRMSYRRKN